ncbi:uncharacterized protein fok isoform X2 [Drosophila kikkawai]|uniref:Uncharacterized protein fok isoform X2 n=1 Tax=Drosophila kikkawai TaxID=30033 RepID=A0A6P4I5W8_DROKI|nr:uncharacterized protein LOC108072560 isoform X2 [Drosophila kikkawai]
MLKRLLSKMRTPFGLKLQATKDKKLSKSNCKCEPTACKCEKRRQLKMMVSQLRRRDNVSSVILF